MKIYTEINYEWKDGHLVETSSNSFDYYGLIERCGGGSAGTILKKATTTVSDTIDAVTEPVKEKVIDPVVKKVVEPAADVVSDVGGAVTGVATDVVGAVGDTASGAGDVVGDLGSKAGDAATGAVEVVKEVSHSAPDAATVAANKATAYMEGMKDRKWNISVPTASDFKKGATGALGEVGKGLGKIGKGLGKITGAVTEGISTGTSAIGAEASSAGKAATTNVSNLGTGSGGTTGQVASGVMHGGEQVSNVVTSGVTKGLKATETGISNVLETAGEGIEKTKSNILGLHEDIKGGLKYYRDKIAKRLGSDKLIGGLTATASSMIGGTGLDGPGSKSAPGVTETIGSKSSNITMKKAEAAKGQRVKASSRGKRSLRKIA